MRYFGIDYGARWVGLALSDELGSMGFPHDVLANTPRLAEEISALIKREHVGAVVIGESKDFGGKDNPTAKDARALGESLAKRAGVPVFYESEVFTTQEARRAPGTPKLRDASAAALILTSYLSKQHDNH